MPVRLIRPAIIAIACLWPAIAAATAGEGHVDPVGSLVLALVVILSVAAVGGDIAIRLGQPAVLGELLGGMIVGNLSLAGIDVFEHLESDATVDMLSRLGVLILLFEVGLESSVGQMLKVGWSSLLVAVLGVVAPFLLGFGVSAWLLPQQGFYVHTFLGAMLTATSVGITTRVLKDLGKSGSNEARVVLGAAVIDDVMGLAILSVVIGIITAADHGGTLSSMEIGLTLLKSGGFLIGALVLGEVMSKKLFKMALHFRARGVLLATGLAFCFFMSWFAGFIGLAPLVGAFAAGLILEEEHYHDFVVRGEHGLGEMLHPISSFLVPLFFVTMGLRTDLAAFFEPGVPMLALTLTVAAIVGKMACAAGVLTKGVDRLAVSIGMIPRGEVGLIFANIGLTLTIGGAPVVSQSTFSAAVVMVIVTTLITPVALKWRMKKTLSPSAE